MNEPTTEEWFAIIATILFFITSFFYVLFCRISVKHIEQEMAKEGKLPPEWDKGIGGRGTSYAFQVLFHRFRRENSISLIDVDATTHHARKKDWYLALFYMSSLFVTLIIMMLFSYVHEG